ncbi:MAG: tRNA pseudouridine(55) synthase TruB [Dehalococcoidales bacterium]|nr:tRNA pseudouridine(55) synthase TruB [Dehalococcoidales bacterium]
MNINKPAGMTSYAVVATVKRLSGEKRVGHAGTLDPDATGVLPLCTGQATRIVEFLADAAKTYHAVIELGTTTDTYDASGKVTGKGDASAITRELCQMALDSFVGTIEQTPPMFSALKRNGKPLYQLARAGITVERASRNVEIYRLRLTGWQLPLVTIEVECSKGTYIRSLAHDLGQRLGCGAHLKNLERTRYGIFDIGNAITLPVLEEACRGGYWHDFTYSIDSVLLELPAMVVDSATAQAIKSGKAITPGEGTTPTPESLCRVYTLDGDFLAVLRYDAEKATWQPKKVFC